VALTDARELGSGGAAGVDPAAPPRPKRSLLARRKGRIGIWYVMPWVIGFFLWYAIPMLASLWFSFTDFNLVDTKPTEFIGLHNWSRLISDPEAKQAVVNTVQFGLISLPFSILVPMALAYLLVSKNLKFRNGFRLMFYLPSVIPLVAAVLLFGGILNGQTGWVNRLLAGIGIDGPNWFLDEFWVYPSLTFLGLWGVGNAMIIFIAGMNSVSSDLYDAATIDGASQFRLFRHITLPMVSPVIFYQLIISLIGLFNYFLVPFVLTNGLGRPNGRTIFYALYFFRQGFRLFDMGYAAALAWALFIAAIAITGLLFWSAKYWVHYEYVE
jgi:multiple sugar transport system permease protein